MPREEQKLDGKPGEQVRLLMLDFSASIFYIFENLSVFCVLTMKLL